MAGSLFVSSITGSSAGTLVDGLSITGSVTIIGGDNVVGDTTYALSASSNVSASAFYGDGANLSNVSGDARSVAGDTDNAVMTWVTSDNTFAAEAGATFASNILTLTADSSALKFGAGTDVTFTHDGGTGMDIVSAGTLDVGSTAGSMTVGSALADGQTIKLGKSGAVEVTIAPHGTAAAEMFSVKNTAGELDGTQTGGVAIGAVNLTAVAGGMGLTWANGKNLWAEGGSAVITANEDAADCIKLHADAGTSQTITALNDAGTADGTNSNAAGIQLTSTAGGMGLSWNDAKDLWAEGGRAVITANEDAASCIKLHADAGTSQTIHLVNDAGTSVTEGSAAIQLLSSAGGIGIKSTANLASAILITADGGTSETIKIHADQSEVDGAAGAGAIELTSDAGGISLNAAAGKDIWAEAGSVILTANEDAASCIKLHADAGTSQTITVLNDAGTADGTNSNAAGVQLTSTAGGIGLSWADAKDLWAEGGRFVVTANEDAADCIKLHADAGSSQTINVVNDAGTSAAAIAITATAGGITLTADSAVIPGDNGGTDLGASGSRWANVYTSDMNFANDRGDWTLIEENNYISFRNNNNGRRFRMLMEDITDSGDYGPDIDGNL